MSSPKDEDKEETVTLEEQTQATSSSTKKKKKKNKFKVQDDEISSSTDPVVADYSSLRSIRVDWDKHIATYKPRKYLVLKGAERWYDEVC